MSVRVSVTLCILISALLVAVQALLPATRGGLIRKALFDAGHVPLFAAFGLVLLLTARKMLGRRGERVYWLSFLGVILMGGFTEYVQGFTQRDAEWMDFVRNLLGGGCCLLVLRVFDQRNPLGTGRKSAGLALAALMLAFSLLPLASTIDAVRRRDASFPDLLQFEQSWEERFLGTRDATMMWVDAAPFQREGHALRVRFEGHDFPAIILHEPVADWSGYERLVFDCLSTEPVALNVRVDDLYHNGYYGDRFDEVIPLAAGRTRVEISLAEVEAAPANRSMDLSEIHSLALFLDRPGELLLDDFHLE